MEDIDDVIRKIDGRIIAGDIYLSVHNVCLKCKISKIVISVSSFIALLSTGYFFFTEKTPVVLLEKEIGIMLIWTLVVLVPAVLVMLSIKRCNLIRKLLIKRSALDGWLRAKAPEQQQSMLAIMRTRGLI